MRLEEALAHAADVFEPRLFSALREEIDPDWVTEALQKTGTVTLRRRRLPAEEMIWLVIGMALLRDRPIIDVARTLDIGEGQRPADVSKSAVLQARARLGKEPLEWLFEQTAKTWAHRSADKDRWRGLALYGVDGSTVRVSDSESNANHFGYSRSVRGESAYPLVRLVALMALRSHLLAAASFGPYAGSEYSDASELRRELPGDSLCLIDRGFFSARLLLQLFDRDKNKHWLMRTKEKMKLTVLKRLGKDDALVDVPVSKEARQKDPSLPKTYVARVVGYQRKGFRPQRLITSLLDARDYPAKELAALYHERWELELGYAEIKTQMLDRRESIRSKSVDGVEQELWGLLLAYNLVRLKMEHAARLAKVPPLRVSFITALRAIREEWYLDSLPGMSVGAIPRHLQRLNELLGRFVLPERRTDRSCRREVKIKMSNYPKKRRPPRS